VKFCDLWHPKDLIYPAAGQAIVVQDELANTWQKLPEGQ